jgi:hypothetical protein
MRALTLTPAELVELTGYQQPHAQARWLRTHLRITAPRRADGSLSVLHATVEAAMRDSDGRRASSGPAWSVLV